jgi:hypothetical protein
MARGENEKGKWEKTGDGEGEWEGIRRRGKSRRKKRRGKIVTEHGKIEWGTLDPIVP